jgi:hypothetical protein
VPGAALPLFLHVVEATPEGLDPARAGSHVTAKLLAGGAAWRGEAKTDPKAEFTDVRATPDGARLVAVNLFSPGIHDVAIHVPGAATPARATVELVSPDAMLWAATDPTDLGKGLEGSFVAEGRTVDLARVMEFNRKLCCLHNGGRLRAGRCESPDDGATSNAYDGCLHAMERPHFAVARTRTCDAAGRGRYGRIGMNSAYEEAKYRFLVDERDDDPSMVERFGKDWAQQPLCVHARWPDDPAGCVAALAGVANGCRHGFASDAVARGR